MRKFENEGEEEISVLILPVDLASEKSNIHPFQPHAYPLKHNPTNISTLPIHQNFDTAKTEKRLEQTNRYTIKIATNKQTNKQEKNETTINNQDNNN